MNKSTTKGTKIQITIVINVKVITFKFKRTYCKVRFYELA